MSDVIDNGGKTILVARDDHYGRGLEGKDAAFLGTHFNALSDRHIVDVVRDEGQFNSNVTHTTSRAVELAVEKTAAANHIAIEKIAAASALAAAQNTAAVQAAIAACCCEVKELMRQIDTDNVKLALANTTAELLAIKYRNGAPPV